MIAEMVAEAEVTEEQVAAQAEMPVCKQAGVEGFVWSNLTEEEKSSLDPNDGVFEGYQATDFLVPPKRLGGVELDYVISILQLSRDWLKRGHYLPEIVDSPSSPIAFVRTKLRGFDGIVFIKHRQANQAEYDDAFEILVDTTNHSLGILGQSESPAFSLIPDPPFKTLAYLTELSREEFPRSEAA